MVWQWCHSLLPPTEDKLAHESSMWNCIKLKISALIQMWCKFWSCIKANLCNRSHLQWDLPVCKSMALPFHPQLLQFQPRGKCVGWGGQLAWCSDSCWCDVVCTKDDRSAVNQSQHYINFCEFGFNVFLKTTLCGVSFLSIVVRLSALHATSSGNVTLITNYHYSLYNNPQ